MFSSSRFLVLVALLSPLVMASGEAVFAEGRDRGRDRAIANEIRGLREQIDEPPELAARPWPPFVIQEAVNYCDPGFLLNLERAGRDCGIEFDKFRLGVKYLVEVSLNDSMQQFMDPSDPALIELAEKLNLPPAEAGKTIDALAAVVGIPVASCSCLAKGFVRVFMGEGPATEEQLRKIDGLTDLFQLRGFLGATRNFLKNPDRFSELAREAFDEDAVGAIDTGLGPTQLGGWLGRIQGIWTNTSLGKWKDAVSQADRAHAAFEACQVEGALLAQEEVLPKLLVWSDYWRRWIRHAENQRFCNETRSAALEEWSQSLGVPALLMAQLPGMTDPAAELGDDLEELIQGYQAELEEVKTLALIHPKWAEPGEIAAKRAEVDGIVARLEQITRMVDQAAATCEIDRAIDLIRGVDQNSACFRVAAGAGASNELSVQLEKLRELKLAQRAMRSTLQPALDEGLRRLRACDLETWALPMEEAISGFDRLYPAYPVSSLRACWEGQWPGDALTEAYQRRDRELAGATRRARANLEEARKLIDRCFFDEAEPLLLEAADEIRATGCALGIASCSTENYNPVICSLDLVHQQISEAGEDLGARQGVFAEEAAEILRIGGELEAWADEQESLLDGPGRCEALMVLPAIAVDLENLRPPEGCDDRSVIELGRFRRRAADLKALVLNAESAEQREIEAVVNSGRQSFSDCDAEGLAAAKEQLDALEAAACRPSNRGAEIAALERGLADAAATAERIEGESNARLAAWEDHCDEEGIVGFEAGLSNLPVCGWQSWDEYRRGELRARMAEVEAIRTTRLPALRKLRRQLDARRVVGEGYLHSIDGAIARGLDACREIDGLKRIVGDAETWLAGASPRLGLKEPLPSICYADRLAALRSLEGQLRTRLAVATVDCPTDRFAPPASADDKDGWEGERVEDAWGGRRLEETEGGPGSEIDRECSGPRPAYQAALQRLVSATSPYNPAGIKAALTAMPRPRCPGDQERLNRIKGPVLAAARAEADVNTDEMAAASRQARIRAAKRSAAIAELVGIAQRELDRYQQSRASSSGLSSAETGPTRHGGADGDSSTDEGARPSPSTGDGQKCMLDPELGVFGSSNVGTSYYVEESNRSAGGRVFRAYKLWRAAPDYISTMPAASTFYGGYSSIAEARRKLDQLCPPAERGNGSIRF